MPFMDMFDSTYRSTNAHPARHCSENPLVNLFTYGTVCKSHLAHVRFMAALNDSMIGQLPLFCLLSSAVYAPVSTI